MLIVTRPRSCPLQAMKDAFDSQDVSRLQAVAETMDREEFARHLQRCIACGLWVPEKNKAGEGARDEEDPGAATEGTSVRERGCSWDMRVVAEIGSE